MDQKKLAARLRQARLSQHVSLRELEALSEGKITNGYISMLEHGKIMDVSPTKLRTLAVLLKLNYLELMVLAGYLTVQDLKGKV